MKTKRQRNWEKIECWFLRQGYVDGAYNDDAWSAAHERFLDVFDPKPGDIGRCEMCQSAVTYEVCEVTGGIEPYCGNCEESRVGRIFDRAVARGEIIKDARGSWCPPGLSEEEYETYFSTDKE